MTLSMVAAVDGAVVGHVAASALTLSDGAPDWYGLGPLSVHPAHQGRGIGSRLMEAVVPSAAPIPHGTVSCHPAFEARA